MLPRTLDGVPSRTQRNHEHPGVESSASSLRVKPTWYKKAPVGFSILARPIGWPFVVCYVAFIVGEFILTRPTRGRPDQRDRGTFYAYMAVMAVSFSLNFGLYFSLPRSAGAWPRVGAGLVLALAAESLRVVGKRQLGRFFTMTVTIQQGHRLIRQGLYSRMRHPLYGALALFFLAWPLTIPSAKGAILGLFAGCGILLVTLWRISVEEEALSSAFGQEWESYARRTWRLLPWVY